MKHNQKFKPAAKVEDEDEIVETPEELEKRLGKGSIVNGVPVSKVKDKSHEVKTEVIDGVKAPEGEAAGPFDAGTGEGSEFDGRKLY